MYKNKEKQREATKVRVRRYRVKEKGVTLSWMEREDRIGEDGWGVTELKFSKSRQAKGRLSEGI